MKTLRVIIILVVISISAAGQPDHTLKVLFRYGSKPAYGFEKTEHDDFGGIHGGHVCLGIDSVIVGFDSPVGFNIFPNKRNMKGMWVCEEETEYMKDTISKKYAIVEIPISDSQYHHLNEILADYLNNSPYDYAFFGMRCASATYDVLSQIGIVKQKSYSGIVYSVFYPRLLRKKIFRLARQHSFKIMRLKGRKSREWEED